MDVLAIRHAGPSSATKPCSLICTAPGYWWICSIKVVGAGQSKRVWAPDARWIAANNGARLAVKKFLRKSGTPTNLSHGSLSRLHEAMTVAVSFRETGESSGSFSARQQSSGDAPASGCGSQTTAHTIHHVFRGYIARGSPR
ncbi:hypothetical protein G3M48_002784 [Beauveria asiatica]|uniref:Uncharacterized protein n=1 Tax=Beauveria asiatica TaxID=1069075 RepID=A0AAW0RFB1_9HYPO